MRAASESRAPACINLRSTDTRGSLDQHNYSDGQVISGDPLRYDLRMERIRHRVPRIQRSPRIRCIRTGVAEILAYGQVWGSLRYRRFPIDKSRSDVRVCSLDSSVSDPFDSVSRSSVRARACDKSPCPIVIGDTRDSFVLRGHTCQCPSSALDRPTVMLGRLYNQDAIFTLMGMFRLSRFPSEGSTGSDSDGSHLFFRSRGIFHDLSRWKYAWLL